jgi:hypothetical protein
MTQLELIGFSLAIVFLTISILMIMFQLRKQRDKTFDVFLKLAELEQKLEAKLPLTTESKESTPEEQVSVKVELPPKESSNYFYMTSTTTTPVDPEPKVSESPTEPASTDDKPEKPQGITYKVVSQAETMVRDIDETSKLLGISPGKIRSQFSLSTNRSATWLNSMLTHWLKTDEKRTMKTLESVKRTRKELKPFLKQLKQEHIYSIGKVLYESIKIDFKNYEIRELTTKQYESIKTLDSSLLFTLLNQNVAEAYQSWNNGQPQFGPIPEARLFDNKALNTILASLKQEGITLRIALLVPKS